MGHPRPRAARVDARRDGTAADLRGGLLGAARGRRVHRERRLSLAESIELGGAVPAPPKPTHSRGGYHAGRWVPLGRKTKAKPIFRRRREPTAVTVPPKPTHSREGYHAGRWVPLGAKTKTKPIFPPEA